MLSLWICIATLHYLINKLPALSFLIPGQLGWLSFYSQFSSISVDTFIPGFKPYNDLLKSKYSVPILLGQLILLFLLLLLFDYLRQDHFI